MGGAEEGVLLPSCRQGLRASAACSSALRLQRRIRQLDGGLVGAQETVVLPSRRQGLRTPPPAPVPYDCNAGFANWQAGWSEPKKAWCCQHQGKGCAATPCPTTR